ncbi:MAG: hypothetical protein L3J70_06380 [Gammaproteobacteria bacterium]|nr:hypothetical protein [Gammaproteobacteria bacterium]
MYQSFFSNVKTYSAYIDKHQGFNSPEPIPNIEGWTVWKMEQTEIYKITHNLELTNPEHQLHIIATPMNANTILIIDSVASNEFTISTWRSDSGRLDDRFTTASSFTFIAVQKLSC